jgi:aconitate hydratase
MGAELVATTSVFPADDAVADFLRSEGRAEAHRRRTADTDAHYDLTEEIALDDLVPLIACPSSPGKVVPVREVVGKPIGQVVIGSSASHAMTP